MELITGGELFDKIVSEGRFSQDTARFYFDQLVSGVLYCHSQGVCHRDLKPENLLLDENGDLKISDFGLSALYEGGGENGEEGSRASLLHTTCGTPNYVAPEVLADKGYDGRAADVWSIGVILYVLMAGFLPFDEPTMSALFRKIQKAEFSYPSWFTDEAKDLLNKILVPSPEERITLPQIQQHPWYVAVSKDSNPAAVVSSEDVKESSMGKPMKVQPSQADINAAIQEGTEESTDEKRDEGLRVMNAFDLINMCGGMALNRMFQTSDEKRVRRYTQFTSNMAADDIVAKVKDVLTSLKCEVSVADNSYKIKATLQTPKGMIGIIIQIYMLAESLHFVEVRRGKGDIFEYHKFYNELSENLSELMASSE